MSLEMELTATINAGRIGDRTLKELIARATDMGIELEAELTKGTLRDRVTILATGEPEKMSEFYAWLQEYIVETRQAMHKQHQDYLTSLPWWKRIFA